MRYYHYGYKNNSELKDKEDDIKGCFMENSDSINKKAVYNNNLVIEDDTVYEIDEECIKCRK